MSRFTAEDVQDVIASGDNDFYDADENGFWIGTDGETMTLEDAETHETATFRITVERIA
jgi:hypothetical protein